MTSHLSVWQRMNPWLWFKRHFWQLTITSVVALLAYMVYLDAQIHQKFSGNKWQVPAQVYARPLEFSVGDELEQEELIDELELLSYRNVGQARHRGEYHIRGASVEVIRREFDYAGTFQPQQRLRINFNSGRVQSLRDIANNTPLTHIMFEPWLVTRLISGDREDRMLVTQDDVPELLIEALLLTEDRNFYQHKGVAPLAILRALWANIHAGKAVQGGSTLTQQLIKNMFLTREKALTRKINEALMSVLVEWRYSKTEILTAYLNEVYLGQDGATAVHGFGLASHFYFDRPLKELNIAEISTLVAMVKGPSLYNPRKRPDQVVKRRNLVLRLLFESHHLNDFDYETWLESPLKLASDSRFATGKYPGFMQLVKRELRDVLSSSEVSKSGIKVFTTLSPLAQHSAEAAIQKRIPQLETQVDVDDLEAAIVVSDVKTGGVRAVVGGREIQYQGFNRALDAKRMVGSLVKPAVYLTALNQTSQYHLMTPLLDQPLEIWTENNTLWEPQNYDKKFRQQVPLMDGLVHSLNVPTINLGLKVGVSEVADTLRDLGIDETIPVYPALTLGAISLSPVQINQMYQAIANHGIYHELHGITAVTSHDNHLLYSYSEQPRRVAEPRVMYLLNYILHKVTTEGTARYIEHVFPSINMAGKTGTTDDYRDSWFSGYDKDLLFTGWIGRDDNAPTGLTGSSGALRLFISYQQNRSPKSLYQPRVAGVNVAHFDVLTGQHVQVQCDNRRSVPAIVSSLPAAAECNAPVETETEEEKSFWQRLLGG